MAKNTINIIAAIGKNRELGKNNDLIWRIPNDLARFKKITSGHPVIMGRKTFEEIKRPLPNRINIVVTRNPDFKVEGVLTATSINEAIQKADEFSTDIFIIGGGEIFKQALPLTNKLYLTIIDDEQKADVYFPEYSEFKTVVFEEKHPEETPAYTFVDLVR